jgi:hypothetical protein
MKRAVVVVNKWWELDPALMAMLNDNARPANSPWPDPRTFQPYRQRPKSPSPENLHPVPRAVFQYRGFTAEVWCISDLLEHLPNELQSSSEQKAALLPRIVNYGARPDLVLAVGTAGAPYEVPNQNGNVVVGTKVFMHDGHPNGSNDKSKWSEGPFDQLIESTLDPQLFAGIAQFDTSTPARRFLAAALVPAPATTILMEFGNAALGTLNVTNYAEYTALDPQTVQTFQSVRRNGTAASLETTHGLIRVKCGSPFIFISGITDRIGHFDDDVAPRSHAQNTAAAHNAGVVTSWLLSRLDQVW